MAPDVEIVPLKCFSEQGGKVSAVAQAIFDAADLFSCQVLNMSFGMETDSEALRSAVRHAAEQGVLLVAAAGNNGTTGLRYPAAYTQVIGVGAVDSGKAVSSFSQRNDSVFITAPGQDVYGLSITGPNAYQTWRGTSFSAPMVTAAAALALSVEPELTQAAFENLLRETAEDLGAAGYDTEYGYGLLRVDRLLSSLRNSWDMAWTDDALSVSLRQEEIAPNTPVLAAAASYDSEGRFLGATMVEQATDAQGVLTLRLPRPSASAVLWQIMLLDRKTYAPLCIERTLCQS
jgi:subtilisin family serine protease